MLYKSLDRLPSFLAGDATRFIEVLHPKNDSVDIGFSLGHASLSAGEQSLPHVLDACSETYYILEGQGRVIINKQATEVKKNDLVYIPAGARQYMINTGVGILRFLCIVEPAWYAEQERIEGADKE